MKNKFVIAVLSICLSLSFTGCGAGNTSDAGDSKQDLTSEDKGLQEAGGSAGDEAATDAAASQASEKEEAETEAGADDEAGDAASSEGVAEEETGDADDPAAKGRIVKMGDDDAKLKVGMVTDLSGINDLSFNQSAWTGLLNINDSMGVRVSYIECASEDDFEQDIARISEDGNDITWGIGYKFADAVKKVAEKYSEKNFAIIDWAYDDIPKNVTCAVFRAQEPSYLVGYIAGSVTQSGKVGFIGGVDSQVIDPFRYGFEAGIKAADEKTGKTTELVTAYLGSFEDSDKGMEKANEMYDDGCDIIFHAAGKAGAGVIEAAKASGKYVIGVDSDQSYLAPDNVLTSAVKKVDVAISNITIQYSMGDNIGGKMIEYGLSEQAVGIPASHPLYSDELYDEVMELQRKIISNQIEVPAAGE